MGLFSSDVMMSGGGKSTIISLIPRFYDVLQGSIEIDGHDVRDVTLESLRGQVGIVQQENILFYCFRSDTPACCVGRWLWQK